MTAIPTITERSISFDAKTWIDENKNGKWDSDEKPLAGVHLIVRGSSYVELVTDVTGSASRGEIGSSLVVEAIPPINFRLTTTGRITVSQYFETIAFGFVPVVNPTIPTQTPPQK